MSPSIGETSGREAKIKRSDKEKGERQVEIERSFHHFKRYFQEFDRILHKHGEARAEEKFRKSGFINKSAAYDRFLSRLLDEEKEKFKDKIEVIQGILASIRGMGKNKEDEDHENNMQIDRAA